MEEEELEENIIDDVISLFKSVILILDFLNVLVYE